MKGVPPEIDDLMWRLAEEGGPVAQAEFEARHTRYGPELSRRIRMVAELRHAGKAVCHRPTFTPRPVRVAPTPRWAVGAAVGMAVLAVGAVAYVAASGGGRPLSVGLPPTIETKPPSPPAPTIVRDPFPDQNLPAPVEPKPVVTPEVDKPRDVRMEDTNLTSAITLVASSAKLTVTLAPGFQDQRVTLDYRGLSPIDTLRAMGEQYGFSVFEQGEGQLLIIPARPAEPDRRLGP